MGQTRGFGAIGGSEFGDGFREIVAHGAFREMELGGDVGAGEAITGEAQDLTFAIGERVDFAPGFGGEFGGDRFASSVNPTESGGEAGGGRVFEQVALDAGIEGSAQVAGTGEGGDDDDARSQLEALDFGGEFEAGHFGHFNVGEQDVGRQLVGEAQGLGAVAGLADDREIVFGFEERGKGSEHHGLIFGENDADRHTI